MEIKLPGLEKILNSFLEYLKRDRRKALPYREVVIGTYQTSNLSVDIHAEIVLGETTQPDVEIFLERVEIGSPYCPKCSRPLDSWTAGSMANRTQIGYKGNVCGAEYKGDSYKVLDDVRGEIRKHYFKFWSQYKLRLDSLMKDKPHKYKLKE